MTERAFYITVKEGDKSTTQKVDVIDKELRGVWSEDWPNVREQLEQLYQEQPNQVVVAIATSDGACHIRVQDGLVAERKGTTRFINHPLGITSSYKPSTNIRWFALINPSIVQDGDEWHSSKFHLEGQLANGTPIEITLFAQDEE